MNSHGRNNQKQQFFVRSRARADAYEKRKKDLKMAKLGEVLPDPKHVEVSDGESVPDLEIVEE